MKITKDMENLFGLSSVEALVVNLLDDESLSISDIAPVLSIPRTSLYYILPKLKDRGFVTRKRVNKKTIWVNSFNKKFLDKYKEIIGSNTGTSLSSNITVHHGIDNVFKVFNEITSLPNRSRVYGIQPDESLLKIIEKNDMEKLINFNNIVKKKNIIVEGIVHEKSIESIKNIVPADKIKQFLNSFGERSADTVKLPDDLLEDTRAEIYLYENKVSLINWDKEFAVIIENDDMFELMKTMFKSTKYSMRRYDQNKKVAEELE